MVFKVQREQQLLRDIEGGPGDKVVYDFELVSQHNDENGRPPMLLEWMDDKEVISSDYCTKPAINWGKGRQPLPGTHAQKSQNEQH